MGKIIEQNITRFDGGILDDIRQSSDRGFHFAAHFDNYTNPLRLTPFRDLEADENKTYNIVRFLHANSKLYGYGVGSGNDRPAIYVKSGNVITSSWTTDTDNEASSGTNRNTQIFFHYKNYLYGFSDNRYIWRWGDITGTEVFTEQWQDLTSITHLAQPVHPPADDVAYFFSDNNVHSWDNSTWTANALVLPTNIIITDAEPWGNYLAIACKPKNPSDKSVVFLWDRDSTLTTVSDKIDWGEGYLLYIAVLDGRLIGVTDYFLNDTTLQADGGKLIIKVAESGRARTIKELQKTVDDTLDIQPNAGTTAGVNNRTKIIKDNRLYFPAAATDQSETWRGCASVDSQGRIGFEQIVSGATGIQGMYLIGNYWFFAHSSDGSVERTNDTASNYSYTSVYQSQRFTGGEIRQNKKLLGVTVTNAPLPSGATVTLKYRKDAETTWTTISTNSTANSLKDSAVNIESSGVALPIFKEIQFRIESTGGAEITGLKFRAEILDDDIY